jgi:hypothetical protein
MLWLELPGNGSLVTRLEFAPRLGLRRVAGPSEPGAVLVPDSHRRVGPAETMTSPPAEPPDRHLVHPADVARQPLVGWARCEPRHVAGPVPGFLLTLWWASPSLRWTAARVNSPRRRSAVSPAAWSAAVMAMVATAGRWRGQHRWIGGSRAWGVRRRLHPCTPSPGATRQFPQRTQAPISARSRRGQSRTGQRSRRDCRESVQR